MAAEITPEGLPDQHCCAAQDVGRQPLPVHGWRREPVRRVTPPRDRTPSRGRRTPKRTGGEDNPATCSPARSRAGRAHGGLTLVRIYGDDRVQGTRPVTAAGSSAPHLRPSGVQTIGRHCPLGCQIKSGNFLSPVERADFFWEMLVSTFSLLGFPGQGFLWQRFLVLFPEALLFPGEKDLRKQILSG